MLEACQMLHQRKVLCWNKKNMFYQRNGDEYIDDHRHVSCETWLFEINKIYIIQQCQLRLSYPGMCSYRYANVYYFLPFFVSEAYTRFFVVESTTLISRQTSVPTYRYNILYKIATDGVLKNPLFVNQTMFLYMKSSQSAAANLILVSA